MLTVKSEYRREIMKTILIQLTDGKSRLGILQWNDCDRAFSVSATFIESDDVSCYFVLLQGLISRFSHKEGNRGEEFYFLSVRILIFFPLNDLLMQLFTFIFEQKNYTGKRGPNCM